MYLSGLKTAIFFSYILSTSGFIVGKHGRITVPTSSPYFSSPEDNNDKTGKEKSNGDVDIPMESGRSSDMTDRFKYQVNALMGGYDPQSGPDDERQDGNILNGTFRRFKNRSHASQADQSSFRFSNAQFSG